MNALAPEIVRWSGRELSQAIAERQVSCREVMAAYLAQIERLNPHVNAIVSLRDPDVLLAEADAKDAQLDRGERMGWMHGFPHAVKDLVATAGLRTTQGSPLFRDFVPAADAIVAERIKRAGAVVIGKTNVPEFGLGSQTYNPVFGITRNAYDQGKTAGGSSGGAAAALALRLLPVADGSDMGGSLRNPAAFNNLFGFRPSQGRVPRGPAPEVYLQQLSIDGPMGRGVADVAWLLATLAGYDPRAPLSLGEDPTVFTGSLARDVAGLRVGWLADWGGELPMEEGVLDCCRGALQTLERLGCVVEEVVPAFPLERLWQAWCTLRQWLQAGSLGALYADPAKRAQIKPEAQWEVEQGNALRAVDVYHASETRSAWYRVVLDLFDRYDFLVLPSAQVFPYDAETHWPAEIAGRAMDTYHRWMQVVVPGTMSGCPIMGAPAGFGPRGLPMGLQIMGPPRGDLAVLQLAHAYEQAAPWTRDHLPPLLA